LLQIIVFHLFEDFKFLQTSTSLNFFGNLTPKSGMKKYVCENQNDRLTAGNSIAAMRAARVSQNRSRACAKRWNALCAVLLNHILPALVLLRKPLSGLSKRQLPRTLCAIVPKNS
jgi:hypothetical protein